MAETDTAEGDYGELERPMPTELPGITVSRGLIDIPDALRFWRRKKKSTTP